MGTLDNLNDHRLFDMFVATGHVGYLHAVTVQSRHRVALSHKEHALLYLRFQVQPVRVVTYLREKIIPCHFLHHIDGEHLQRMGIKFQCLEYLLERERLIRIMLEEVLQQLADLLLP